MIVKTHCLNGHEFTVSNTRQTRKQRVCRSCEKLAGRRYRDTHPDKRKVSLRDNARNTKRLLVEYKGDRCLDCNNAFPYCCYHFDHRVPEEKSFGIASRIHSFIEELKAEADKCDLVCANCHAIRTFGNYAVGKKITKSRLAARAATA